MDKYLIVGLGNPGAEYHETRHNCGWMVADKLAADLGVSFEDKRYGFVAEASLKGRKLEAYYIYESLRQCRSLLVREREDRDRAAARCC